MELHFATIWEAITDVIGDEVAVVHGDQRRTWSEFDERSARVAAALAGAGLGPDAKIGLYLYNGNEYLEAQYAAFKMRAVAVNVNYRYLDDELWYLLDNADAEALVFDSSLADRVAQVIDRLPALKLLIEVGPHPTLGVPYEQIVAGHDPMPRIRRADDDIYMLYTGGTTGMPKGVMYTVRSMTESYLSSGFPLVQQPVPSTVGEAAAGVVAATAAGNRLVSIPCAPLMHGTGIWLGAFIPMLTGGQVVTLTNRSLDADELLSTVERERATNITIVGDAFAKPIIGAIDAARATARPYDTTSLKLIVSSGVMFTSEVKEQVLDRIEQVMILDAMGSTEGAMGMSVSMRGLPPSTATFSQMPNTKVFTEDGREVEPGSGEIGMVAAGGMVPLGYFKDPEKSARTFREIGGVRYSFPGDMAMVAEDGSLILLGRGSQVINTGGEKVFPEEVEEAVKRVAGIDDCLVVGLPDERFGQAVVAVASRRASAETPDRAPDEATVIAEVKHQLAGYKAPKRVVFVGQVPRAPNGKADYTAAKALALNA